MYLSERVPTRRAKISKASCTSGIDFQPNYHHIFEHLVASILVCCTRLCFTVFGLVHT